MITRWQPDARMTAWYERRRFGDMKRLLITLLLIVMFPSFAKPEDSIAYMMRRWNDPAIQQIEAFQIFDNLYYVGIEWVAAYVIKTND